MRTFPGHLAAIAFAVSLGAALQAQPSDPPDALVDAMQTGDRLSYHLETAQAEIAHFHHALPKAQAAIARIGAAFDSQLEDHLRRYSPERWLPGGMNMAVLKQSRTAAMTRALKLAAEADR